MRAARVAVIGILLCGFVVAGSPRVEASAIVAGFNANTLPPNDDGSTGLVNVGFMLDFFGSTYTQLYVNNNGNVTFTGPLFTFTPFPLLTTATPIIAPFFADVDTRFAGDPVTYGTGTFGGFNAFGVNWLNVDYFASSTNHTNRNSFQLIVVDRSDTGVGNFDFMFNYAQVQWETGQASGSDAQGCGGFSARVGWSNGVNTAFELPGSAVNGAFLDSGTCVGAPGPFALIFGSLNSGVDGRYLFSVRNGQVVGAVPEPASLGLLGAGLLALMAGVRRRKA